MYGSAPTLSRNALALVPPLQSGDAPLRCLPVPALRARARRPAAREYRIEALRQLVRCDEPVGSLVTVIGRSVFSRSVRHGMPR